MAMLPGRQRRRSPIGNIQQLEPLEDRRMLSCVIDVRVHGSTDKNVTLTAVGQVVTLDIYAVVSGHNSDGADEGLQSFHGSFLSASATLRSASKGDLLATVDNKFFRSSGYTVGTQQDLNGDGSLDVGSNDGSSATGFYVARASSTMFNGTIDDAADTDTFFIGTLTYTVKSLRGGTTDINFQPRMWSNGYPYGDLWVEDGQAEDGQPGGPGNPAGDFHAGDPVILHYTAPDNAPPVATVSATNIDSVGGSAYQFQVTYADDVAIDMFNDRRPGHSCHQFGPGLRSGGHARQQDLEHR